MNDRGPTPLRAWRSADTASGAGYALLAYVSWGLMPVYWKAVGAVPPLQMVAHRVLWSVPVLVLLVLVFRRGPDLWAALTRPSHLLVLVLTSGLISANWLVFIVAIQREQVVEVSLGYFINPLFNVAAGMLLLGERLRPVQYLAVLLAAAGVVWLTWQQGTVPWLGLALAATFCAYGLVRKVAPVEGMVGLTVETLLLLPVAAAFLLWVQAEGSAAFLHGSRSLDVGIAMAGLITALPLLWFTNAARGLRYTTLGLFQYISPTGHLLLALLVFGEPFGSTQLVSFTLIWCGLALYTADSFRALKR